MLALLSRNSSGGRAEFERAHQLAEEREEDIKTRSPNSASLLDSSFPSFSPSLSSSPLHGDLSSASPTTFVEDQQRREREENKQTGGRGKREETSGRLPPHSSSSSQRTMIGNFEKFSYPTTLAVTSSNHAVASLYDKNLYDATLALESAMERQSVRRRKRKERKGEERERAKEKREKERGTENGVVCRERRVESERDGERERDVHRYRQM